MPDDNFFKTDEETTEEVVEEKVKVGDKEFTQDELSKLVGLGEIAVEAEEKYNRPISKFWPEYTKAQQELDKLREENETLRTPKQPVSDPTDQEKVMQQARDELNKLGYIPAEEVDARARRIAGETIAGYRLLDQVNGLVERHQTSGDPATTPDELLEFMADKKIEDPEIAYKIKFEKELDEIKEKKLASLKPSGLVTEATSTAGAKVPQPVKLTRSNLSDVLDTYLTPRG